MADQKRRDSRGRVLKTGESQRKDGLYQYRYTDIRGKRHVVYNSDLSKLREQETIITKELLNGFDFASGNITVIELVRAYTDLKKSAVKRNTIANYNKILKRLQNEDFGHMIIRNIKMSQAKSWFKSLSDQGLKRNSINQIKGVLKPAFEMAVQDDIVHKNPFNFRLDFLPSSSSSKDALSPETVDKFFNFVQSDPYAVKYLDIYIILLGTGMRIGELCGLTFRDIDLRKRRIDITHQLNRKEGGGLYVATPKTSSSIRSIPMSDPVFEAFRRVVTRRPQLQVEPMIDGYTGFLFVNPSGSIMINTYVSKAIWNAIRRYNETHDDLLPSFSPHSFRHTFCTNLIDAGVNVKTVQYLMGHSSATITLDVYTHSNYKKAEIALGLAKPDENASFTTPLLHHFATNL